MTSQDLYHLKEAEQLFDQGNLNKALEIFSDKQYFQNLNPEQKIYYHFLNGLVLVYHNRFEELINLGKELWDEGQSNGNDLQSLDGNFFTIMGFIFSYQFDEAFKLIEKYEVLLKKLYNEPKDSIIRREARIKIIKGLINLEKGNVDIAENHLSKAIEILKPLMIGFEIVWAHIILARVLFQGKKEFQKAIKCTNFTLSLAKKIKFNDFWVAFCHLAYGVVYGYYGEFDECFKHYLISLELYRKINSEWYIAMILNNLGATVIALGDYESAFKYLEESLEIYKKLSMDIELPLVNLIEMAIEINDMPLAQKYYDKLKSISLQKKEGMLGRAYEFTTALMLKNSPRIRDKAKAEEILKEIVKTDSIWFDLVRNALIHLCDLLFSEYKINHDSQVLIELNQNISMLQQIAEKQGTYPLFCQTFILQAKLALVNLDIKSAQRFLTQAQKIVDSYGLKRLAMKISHEYDEILKQLDLWKELKKGEANFNDRLELAGLNAQIEQMVKRRMITVPMISDEEAILLLIVSEGGIPLFSHSFKEVKPFESYLFSGFITTIDYFIREMFSEGLDRAVFGQHTLLIKSIPPFFVSYIFKGDSYYAHQRIKNFIEKLQSEKSIWQFLVNAFEKNLSIQLDDNPMFESLIIDTFTSKKIVT